MSALFNYLSVFLVGDDQTPVDPIPVAESLFLTGAFRLGCSRIVAKIGDDAIRDESLGHLWSDFPPLSVGYTFELATELPFFLPNIESCPEYILKIDKEQYVICNRMVRAFFCDASNKLGETEYFLVHRLGLGQLKESQIGQNYALCPVPMKSFISRKFIAQERTAEESIIANFASWLDDFIAGVSSVLQAFRSIGNREFNNILPISSPASCPIIWVALTGYKEKSRCEQFTGSAGMLSHRAFINLNSTEASRIRSLLLAKQAPTAFEDAIGLAKTFLFYGYLELAVIQVCTACESLISPVVIAYLKSRGVSQGTIKDQFNEVTFSELLNFFLPAIVDLSKIRHRGQIWGSINWARKRRNEIVHTGFSKEILKTKSVEEAIRSAEELAAYIKPS